MNANELRIGNWYCWNAGGKNYEYQVKQKDFKNDNYRNFEPIPLTEDWLLRFDWKDGFSKGMLDRQGIEIGIFGHYLDIKYVHQLQNIIFALTGDELTII
jgi:hypothetical protein